MSHINIVQSGNCQTSGETLKFLQLGRNFVLRGVNGPELKLASRSTGIVVEAIPFKPIDSGLDAL